MTRKECPTCNGRGKIRNPRGLNGKTGWLDEDITCPNCQGEGFVGIPDNPPRRKPPYTSAPYKRYTQRIGGELK